MKKKKENIAENAQSVMSNLNIKFQHNWNNKLDNPLFTTIMKDSFPKYEYYHDSVGKTFDVILNDSKHCEAILANVFTYKFGHIPLPLLMIDTGIVDIKKVLDLFKKFGITTNDSTIILVFKVVHNK